MEHAFDMHSPIFEKFLFWRMYLRIFALYFYWHILYYFMFLFPLSDQNSIKNQRSGPKSKIIFCIIINGLICTFTYFLICFSRLIRLLCLRFLKFLTFKSRKKYNSVNFFYHFFPYIKVSNFKYHKTRDIQLLMKGNRRKSSICVDTQ